MQRVLRWDGIVPQKKDGSDTQMTPDDIRAIKAYVEANASSLRRSILPGKAKHPAMIPNAQRPLYAPG
ncbi:hypothetical protein KSZ_19330 [Dictyobacter formicarum]|uniref:Cytochrome c domain-containing protein n=2 Tax=Dictyobacter formicarum TaxID=2778368 RepID=A0ABQ3VCR0_9CHLR|nr:hypothetical protein KSZ_19330 [Dictyobacter formicarum]